MSGQKMGLLTVFRGWSWPQVQSRMRFNGPRGARAAMEVSLLTTYETVAVRYSGIRPLKE